jgi:hypothetical protein
MSRGDVGVIDELGAGGDCPDVARELVMREGIE